MNNFKYAQPRTESEALKLLSSDANSAILAGGTELVGLMKRMIVNPDLVVNISDVDSLHQLELDGTKRLMIGTGVHLDEFLSSKLADSYPAIKQVIQNISSLQLQSQGTIGGELLRRPMCWYYRNGHGLLADHGKLVVEGDNRFHAILGNRNAAKFVNASRIAPALISLGAQVRIAGPAVGDEQFLPVESLYQIPRSDDENENVLRPGQLLTHIVLPPAEKHLSAAYEVKHGEGPDQPLTAAAVNLRVQNGLVSAAKIVMGQVAPIPWISADAERYLIGKPVNEETADRAGNEAVAGAMALSNNEYKIQLAKVAVKRAILMAAGLEAGGLDSCSARPAAVLT